MIEVEPRAGIVRRARTLSERLEIARAIDAATPADDAGVKYLELWSRAFAPGDRAAFLRRLAWEGVTLEQAAVALSDTFAPAHASDAWAAATDKLLQDLQPAPVVDAELPFSELWAALAGAGWRALIRRRAAAAAELGTAGAEAMQRQLSRELSRVGAVAVAEAFKPHGRYDEFIRATLDDRCASLGHAYPVWLRQLSLIVHSWVDATDELLSRLDRDRAAISETFGLAPSRIVAIDPGLSDPHHGRRRVSRVIFDSGLRLIYKPRAISGERALNDLIAWLHSRGVAPALPGVRILDRGRYGWMTDIQHDDFTAEGDVREYYRRAGALLCLMHVLRGRDVHWENVIATHAGPVVIDAELLLQPVADGEAPASPLLTGLLSCLQTGPDGEIVDVGGLRGDRIEHGPTAERIWTGLGTDDIRVSEQFQPIGPKANRVLLNGVVQDPGAYADAFVSGFTDLYRGLLAHRDALLAAGGPIESLRAMRARVLVRPSHQYAAGLHALADPRFQQDGRRWGCALDTLNRRYKFSLSLPRTWCFVAAEREALERLDLPSFSNVVDTTDVVDGDRVIAPGFFRDSGLSAVMSLIRELSEADLRHQAAVLRRVLSQSTRSRFSTALEIPSGEAGVQDHRAALTAVAEWIGRELAARATEIDSGSLPALRLYDGAAGPAILFAALAAMTGASRWREESARAIAPLVAADWSQGDPLPTGATTGVGSVIYALTLIARLSGDERCLDAAARLADRLTEDALSADPASDLSNGIAGALLGLLALNSARADATLIARAQHCGRLLRTRQVRAGDGAAWAAHDSPPRAGFAHGAAGISYALTRLFEITADTSLPPVIAGAHAFERGLFSVADRNWPSAGTHVEQGAVLMTAWCNGAPGIGLERAFAGTIFEDDELAGEVGLAIEAAARAGAAQADHLCCGNIGRADVLFTIGQWLPSRDPMRIGMQIAGTVVARARERGHFRLSTGGAEYEVFTPGFFQGLSGIAYTLLRFSDSRRLPSVLAFGI